MNTEQEPICALKANEYFEYSKKALEDFCGITDEDFQPAKMSANSNVISSEITKMYEITDKHLSISRQLFKKLCKKSSELHLSTIKRFLHGRTVSKTDVSLLPKVVRENQTLKKKFDSEEPLSSSDYNEFVDYEVAYDIGEYRELFLPELYVSVIYSFGRNYFYLNNAANPCFYFDLLKVAYCLASMITQQMKVSDAVLHEYLVEVNGLLRLIVNNDYVDRDDTLMTLEEAIYRCKQLENDSRKYFELGMLKKTKDDEYCRLNCKILIKELTDKKHSLEIKEQLNKASKKDRLVYGEKILNNLSSNSKANGRQEAWKWQKVSIEYEEKFKRLIEHGRKFPDEIIEVNGIRVCLDKEFLIGMGGQSDGVYVGLGTEGTEKAVKLFVKATHGHLAEQDKKLLRKCETKESTCVVKYWFLDDTSHSVFAFLIMDLCEETLESFVRNNSRDELVERAPGIIRQILKGLANLHSAPDRILHRDLKPLNILRNVNYKWFLADFGIGRMLPNDDSTYLSVDRGTKKWKAVESCYQSGISDDHGKEQVRYKPESDIQVAGMVAFYILTKGKHPFGDDEQQILTNLHAPNPVNLNMLDDRSFAHDFISWMLKKDPKDRPSADEALQHPYLKSKEQQFTLLCEVGNYIQNVDANSDVLKELKKDKADWQTRVGKDILDYLCHDTSKKKRKKPFRYEKSWTGCLRLIRNMKQHWNHQERNEPEAKEVRDPQEFFLDLFPDLVLKVYKIARSCDDLKQMEYFKEQ